MHYPIDQKHDRRRAACRRGCMTVQRTTRAIGRDEDRLTLTTADSIDLAIWLERTPVNAESNRQGGAAELERLSGCHPRVETIVSLVMVVLGTSAAMRKIEVQGRLLETPDLLIAMAIGPTLHETATTLSRRMNSRRWTVDID